MRVEIDPDLCQGHGRCTLLASEVFDTDEDGYGIVTDSGAASLHADEVKNAIANCPESAIRLT